MRYRYRTTMFNLLLEERNYRTVTAEYISEADSYELRPVLVRCGDLAQCNIFLVFTMSGVFNQMIGSVSLDHIHRLDDLLTHTLARTHDVRRIYRFVRADQHETVTMIPDSCKCRLVSTEHIVLDRLHGLPSMSGTCLCAAAW